VRLFVAGLDSGCGINVGGVFMTEQGGIVPRQLRHDLRGTMNGLKLCAAALDSPCTKEETLEFLGDIESLCDKLVELVDKIEALPG
jgi:hypothetical protein